MAVDPAKPKKIFVIHGVQTGKDADQNQHQLITELVKSRLGNVPLPFECELYQYENINDQAQSLLRKVISLIIKNPLGAKLTDQALDLVGDVVISLKNGSTAHVIRQGLQHRLLEIYAEGNPCYIVAHSLGSIYAFDVINQLITTAGLFDRSSRKTWPVQGFLTIGSPICLPLFYQTGRQQVANLGPGDKWLRWINIWDRNDPIVSGNIFGQHIDRYQMAEHFIHNDPMQGWMIRDIAADMGKAWLLAHVAYWHSPVVGDKLVDMMA